MAPLLAEEVKETARRQEGRPHSPIRGDCIRICPIPHPPKQLPLRLKKIVEEASGLPEGPAKH